MTTHVVAAGARRSPADSDRMGIRELQYWASTCERNASILDDWPLTAGAATKVRAVRVAARMVAQHAAETRVQVERYRQLWVDAERAAVDAAQAVVEPGTHVCRIDPVFLGAQQLRQVGFSQEAQRLSYAADYFGE